MKIAVVINPSSAGGRTLKLWPAIAQKLEADGFVITSHISLNEPDFRNQLRAFSRNFKTIGVCGGDSSLTIGAEELYQSKFTGTLKFFPAGSVNDIVLDIREQIAGGNLWLGNISAEHQQKLFIGQANWGLGVVVNRWVGKILHAIPLLRPLQNPIGIFCILLSHLLRKEIVAAEITANERKIHGAFSIILVSQIKHWAGGLQFCPSASFSAPEFQLILVARCRLIRLLRIILAAKTGGHLQYPEVMEIMARKVAIRLDKPQAVQIDGDILRHSGSEVLGRAIQLEKRKSKFTLQS